MKLFLLLAALAYGACYAQDEPEIIKTFNVSVKSGYADVNIDSDGGL